MTVATVTTRLPSGYVTFRGRHFVTDQTYSAAELRQLLDLAIALRALSGRKRLTPFLPGATLAILFEHGIQRHTPSASELVHCRGSLRASS